MKYCVSLETARKLREKGWPQEKSTFVWITKGGRICGGYCDGGTTHIKYTGKYEGEIVKEDELLFADGDGLGTSHEGTHINRSEYGNDNNLHYLDFIAAPSIGELLQAFYEKEVNVRLQSFWDAEWTVEWMSGTKWVNEEPGVFGSPADMLASLWMILREKGIV